MNFEQAYEKYSSMWNTPLRFYHTVENHLDKLLVMCDTVELKYFALFHDIVYDPYSNTNEEDSIEFFKKCCFDFDDLKNPGLVINMIKATKNHKQTIIKEINDAINIDLSILYSSFDSLIEYENNIFKEYQKIDIKDYIRKRIYFLRQYRNTTSHIKELMQYITSKKYSIGIYAGSFDPFHIGHLDILKKVENLFDKVIIVRADNPEKNEHTYPMPKTLPNQIIEHKGLITDLLQNSKNIHYTLIRGIRNEYDIATEINYMSWVHEFKKDIQFVHIFCDSENTKISSSQLKSFAKSEYFDINKYIVK